MEERRKKERKNNSPRAVVLADAELTNLTARACESCVTRTRVVADTVVTDRVARTRATGTVIDV